MANEVDPPVVTEFVARFPKAGALLALIKRGGVVKGAAGVDAELLDAFAALAADVVSAPGPATGDNASGAAGPAAAAARSALLTPKAETQQQQQQQQQLQAVGGGGPDANADAAAFAHSLVVLEGVVLQAPRSGKVDLGFGSDCLLVRSAKAPMLTVPYKDIEHIIIMDRIPQQPEDRNGVMLALRRGASLAGVPAPASASAALNAPPDTVVFQTRTVPLRLRAPEVARHVGEWLEGPAAVVMCQLFGCLLRDVGEHTFLAADTERGFKSSRGLPAVSANIRANGGWLFPLPCGLAYLGKPACFLRLGDVAHIEYGRAAQGSSTFDLLLKVDDKAGGAGGGGGGARGAAAAAAGTRAVELAQIDTPELAKLQSYFAQHQALVGALRKRRAEQLQQHPAVGPNGDWGSAMAPKTASALAAAAAADAKAEAEEDDEDEDESDDDFDPEAGEEDEEEEEEGKGGSAAAAGGGRKRASGAAPPTRGRRGAAEHEAEEGEGAAAAAAPPSSKRARPATSDVNGEEDIGSDDSDDDEEEEEEDSDDDSDDSGSGGLVRTEDMSD